MPIPTTTADDTFLRLVLQAQAAFDVDGFNRWIPVSEIVDKVPAWRESDNRPVPGHIFKNCVEHLAHCRFLLFDMDSEPDWNLQTTRVKLTATGVYRAMLFDKV